MMYGYNGAYGVQPQVSGHTTGFINNVGVGGNMVINDGNTVKKQSSVRFEDQGNMQYLHGDGPANKLFNRVLNEIGSK